MHGTTRVAIVLNGAGRVGRKFIELLDEKSELIRKLTGVHPVLTAVVTKDAVLFSKEGLSPGDAFDWLGARTTGSGGKTGSLKGVILGSGDYESVLDEIGRSMRGVVVEATPTDIWTGEPGLSHITKAISHGFSVITLSKGPLVVAFGNLLSLARQKGVGLRYSGAVAAALPTVDTAIYSMAGADIYEIEGVLNGTTNYILNRMSRGEPCEEALRKAQEMGIAEANPTLDVEGYDSAAKLLIIANTVWGTDFALSDVEREGITGLDGREVQALYAAGTPVRLVARARWTCAPRKSSRSSHCRWPDPGSPDPSDRPCRAGDPAAQGDKTPPVELSVHPQAVPKEHPFGVLPGTSKAVKFSSREMGDVIISGGASDVTGAAASCIKDLIHILEEGRVC